MKKYPIGIQDFKKLREEGYLYVDKTEEIYRLLTSGNYYFLSRPRRFGKSLLISTLKYLFQGERESFEGLWIEKHYDFEPHPVLHFSFSTLGYKDIGLEAGLYQSLDNKAEEAGIRLKQKGIGPRFQELIRQMARNGRQLVVLIDEYDKPLVDYIDDPAQAEVNRDILKNFFSVVKDADPFLRLFLLT
ncbi:MAG: AAA family ATPase, partial [Bacteroidetes bacterium]